MQGVRTSSPLPPEMTYGFLIQLVFTSGHRSVTPFLSGGPLLKKILDPSLAVYLPPKTTMGKMTSSSRKRSSEEETLC